MKQISKIHNVNFVKVHLCVGVTSLYGQKHFGSVMLVKESQYRRGFEHKKSCYFQIQTHLVSFSGFVCFDGC